MSLSQMIIRIDRPLAYYHPDGPASCKWLSGGTSLLQMIIFSFKTFHLGLQILGSRFNLADLSRRMCSCVSTSDLYDVPETSSMSRMLGLTGALWQMVRSGGAVPARTLDSVIIVTNDFGFTEINKRRWHKQLQWKPLDSIWQKKRISSRVLQYITFYIAW